MPPPIKQEGLPPLAECLPRLENAVDIKLKSDPKIKMTAQNALYFAGFDRNVASNPSMLSRFRRLYSSKVEVNPPATASALQPRPPASPAANPKRPPSSSVGAIIARARAAPPVSSVKVPRQPNDPLSPLTTAATPAAAGSTASHHRFPKRLKGFTSYRTPHQVTLAYKRKKLLHSVEAAAMNSATNRYIQELNKPHGERESARSVAQAVNEEFGSKVNDRTLRRYVQEGFVGQGLKKGGPPSVVIPDSVYPHLLEAYETHILLVQEVKPHEATASRLRKALMATLGIDTEQADRLMNRRLRRDSADSISTGKPRKQDSVRVDWTTEANLNLWFDTWETRMVELGFARKMGDGSVVFDYPERIINIDETNLSLDEATSPGTGGRPENVFFGANHPRTGRLAYKSSVSCTGLFGCTASGVALPPHFQFKCAAKADAQKVRADVFMHIPKGFAWIDGTFREPTIGSNEKGGMDSEGFRKYVSNIRMLYDDCSDTDGKRICIKCDSGPGRRDPNLLAWCKQQGVVIYPCVPNTTHVTQEMDQVYSGFKTDFRRNLKSLVEQRLCFSMTSTGSPGCGPATLGLRDVGLIIFGTHIDDELVLESIWDKHFSKENLLSKWRRVGACPLTRACLKDPQVRREVFESRAPSGEATLQVQEETIDSTVGTNDDLLASGVGEETVSSTAEPASIESLEAKNQAACDKLNELGCNGEALRVLVPKRPEPQSKVPITVPIPREYYEQLSKATATAGQTFVYTDGDHLTSSAVAIALETRARDARVKELRAFKLKATRENKALAKRVELDDWLKLNECDPYTEEGASRLTSENLETLLKGHMGVKTLPKELSKTKAAKLQKWLEIRHEPAVVAADDPDAWTEDHENELQRLLEDEVEMKDTAYAREQKKQKLEASSTLLSASPASHKHLGDMWLMNRSPGTLNDMLMRIQDRLKGAEQSKNEV